MKKAQSPSARKPRKSATKKAQGAARKKPVKAVLGNVSSRQRHGDESHQEPSQVRQMHLPVSYEEAKIIFSQEVLTQKLMEFVTPLDAEEEKVIRHLVRAKQSGKILFVHGEPGSGKSTFVESLGWRKHIGIRKIVHINASDYLPPNGLIEILKVIHQAAQLAAKEKDLGPTVVVLDYLESLEGYEDEPVKGFYRTLNGILRSAPLLILWPVVSNKDAHKMIGYSEGVSGTMFTRGEEILDFSGPPLSRFMEIAEKTIAVANEGRTLSDFGLTRGDLEDTFDKFKTRTKSELVVRKYLEAVRDIWIEKSGFLKTAVAKIPKFPEVWFVVCHTKAEDVVKGFTRRGDNIEDAWLANHDALYEYVKGTQRQGFWSARKLQMAINGVISTRILYIPTNCIVAAIAAYSTNQKVRELILSNGGSRNWLQKRKAQTYFKSTPIYRQLASLPQVAGKRKSGPGHEAINKAEPAFVAINNWLVSGGGHDSVLNEAVAALIRDTLGDRFEAVEVGRPHPWIPNVVPDIRIDLKDVRRHVNMEFHFTNNKKPSGVADYCLRKLQVYLLQVEQYLALEN